MFLFLIYRWYRPDFHRSSPLNLTAVGNLTRKRKSTSGQTMQVLDESFLCPDIYKSSVCGMAFLCLAAGWMFLYVHADVLFRMHVNTVWKVVWLDESILCADVWSIIKSYLRERIKFFTMRLGYSYTKILRYWMSKKSWPIFYGKLLY